MRGHNGSIIYIGKAKSLKKRVHTYFQNKSNHSYKTQLLLQDLHEIDTIVLKSESEALLLECQFIKEFKPKYNILLKDDKQYPYLKIHTQLEIPRLEMTRLKKDDGAEYFGPYTDVTLLKETVELFKKHFKIRSCTFPHPNEANYKRCLYSMIELCSAPCMNQISITEYRNAIKDITYILNGNAKKLFIKLTERMKILSLDLQYEKAAFLRDTIKTFSKLVGTQKPRIRNFRRLSQTKNEELRDLKRVLNMKIIPNKIEAFDVSNFGGQEAVGSMICFLKGNPDKRYYRRFKIKSISAIDDIGMIKEIIYRRYKRVLDNKNTLPDLILIDGGKAHLNAGLEIAQSLGIKQLAIIGLAKKYEEIFISSRKDPIILPTGSLALHLVQRIRDEAHRFAITYHKRLRDNKIKSTIISDIPHIGPNKTQTLIKHFGSLNSLKKASFEEIQKVPRFGLKTAQKVFVFFHPTNK